MRCTMYSRHARSLPVESNRKATEPNASGQVRHFITHAVPTITVTFGETSQ